MNKVLFLVLILVMASARAFHKIKYTSYINHRRSFALFQSNGNQMDNTIVTENDAEDLRENDEVELVLESAFQILLNGGPNNEPPFPLKLLPKSPASSAWADIKKVYALSLVQILALQNYVSGLIKKIDAWLEDVFGGYKPHLAYLLQNDSYIGGSLFSSHHKDMSSELIGFDLPGAIQIIDANLKIPRSAGNAKRIIGTVRGIGGGKTRILEELRQHYQRSQESLIVSVTFNSKWKPHEVESKLSDNPEVCLALSLVARMASVFYNIKLSEVLDTFNKDDVKFLTSQNVDLLYRRFIRRIVTQVRKCREVKQFIFSIDETILMDDILRKDNTSDLYSPVRKALLEDDDDDALEGLETALVMSTLDPSPLGKTESGRGIKLLPPTILSGNAIVEKWWKEVEVTLEEKSKLVAFATMLSPIPRLVEFGWDFINTKIDKSTGKLLCEINDNFLGSMLESIQLQISERYGEDMPAIPSIDVLYDIIYGLPISIVTAKPLVRGSVLTNDIAECKKQVKHPKFSILIFESSLKCSKYDVSIVTQALANIIQAVKTIGKFKGYSLEVFFREWFAVRTYLALRNPQKKLTTGTLLGLETSDNIFLQVATASMLDIEIPIPAALGFKCIRTMNEKLYQNLPNSGNVDAFYQSIMNDKPTEHNPVVLLQCLEGDHQDFVLMVYSGDVDKPRVHGLDAKARDEINISNTENKDTYHFPGNNHLKWRVFCDKYSLPFSFIYITTHDKTTFDRDGVLVLRRSIASKFFLSMWETYLAARNVDEYASQKDT